MVHDPQRDLADAIGAVYAAAAGDGGWHAAGARLRALLGAQLGALRLPDGTGLGPNILGDTDPWAAKAYGAYYHAVDPYRAQGRRTVSRARMPVVRRALLGAELVPDSVVIKSEFYVDFSRRAAQHHLLAGMVGTRVPIPLGFYRPADAKPFDRRERHLLDKILPHLQQALALAERLGLRSRSARMSLAALDALAVKVVLVDVDMKVLFANAAALAYLAGAHAALSAIRSGPGSLDGIHLCARHRDHALPLRRLVAGAAAGGAGGVLRVRDIIGDAERGASHALLVSPAPDGWMDAPAGPPARLQPGLAVIVIQDLTARMAPPADLLCALHGFTRAEAVVATALVGGASAEEVARQRHVSLDTVRSQIRSILAKSESVNLRDLERWMASLTAVLPRSLAGG